MFFSDNILTRKGPLANIWMAAHWDRKLSKTQVMQTNLHESINSLLHGILPTMALRLSGQLLLGVTKIYSRKARYLLDDCSETLSRLRAAFQATATASSRDHASNSGHHGADGSATDAAIPETKSTRAGFAQITMAAPQTLDDATITEPELDLDALLASRPAEESGRLTMNAFTNSNQPFSFALQTITDDLPLELQQHLEGMDVEIGRRASRSSEQDPEIGRRLHSSAASLPFSPLRNNASSPMRPSITDKDGGAAMANDNMFDNDDVAQDEFDNLFGAPALRNSLEGVNTALVVPGSDIHMEMVKKSVQRKKSAAGGTKKRRSTRKAIIQMDEQTEMDASSVLDQVNTASINVPTTDAFDDSCVPVATQVESALLAAGVANMSLGSDLPTIPAAMDGEDIVVAQPQSNLFDDNDMIYDNDDNDLAPMASSPKSPRLMPNVHNVAAPVAAMNEEEIFFASEIDSRAVLEQWNLPAKSTTFMLDLVPAPRKRRQLADTFMHILALHTMGLVHAHQDAAFAPITISV